MKWAIILFTCDAAKVGPGGPKPCPDFSLLWLQIYIFEMSRPPTDKNNKSFRL